MGALWRPGWGICGLEGSPKLGGSVWVLAPPRVALDKSLVPLSGIRLPMSGSKVESSTPHTFPTGCLGSALHNTRGLSSLGVWGSLPYLLLEMRVFLRKLPQVWGTLIGMAQLPLAWLLKSQAPFSVVQQ